MVEEIEKEKEIVKIYPWIFLPFLVIDFAVASILTSLGMVMVSPMMFSLPLKLIVFALADGWTLLSLSLVQSYFN
ncbi:MAG: hypothetical protein EBX07_07955 [Burkholderiaceae bacterium]|nr:hypothetical protein [Burkholderiaceae bacterium]